jgi:hypothetical protein
MTKVGTYDSEFFRERAGEIDVAKIILEIVVTCVRPNSIVDFGTAAGSWLAAAKELGVRRVMGVDGDWVPTDHRHISAAEFVSADFEREIPELGQFDLAVCTEVLEHISAPASTRAVEWLCKSAPVVLFSAAIPFQGGTHHINEAWQSHWAALFRQFGHQTFDLVRPKIWDDDRIPYWYRQNILLMANEDAAMRLGLPQTSTVLDCIHPAHYLHRIARIRHLEARSLSGGMRQLRRLFRRA